MRAPLVVVAVLAVATAARADEDAFYRAAALERDGKPAEAVEAFRAVAAAGEADPFADDALLEMGRILEERLGDPLRAAEAYERVSREHPTSRLATRARLRAEALRAAMGPGAAHARAVAEMSDILVGFAGRPRAESIARMERLVAASPDFPDAPRAIFWLGTTLEGEGRRDAALARYREVAARWPGGEWAERAARAEGDLLLAGGDLDGAERAFRRMSASDPAGLTRVATARARARWALIAWCVLAALAAAAVVHAWRRAGSPRALLRAPIEVLYFVPVALLFVGAGLTENEAMARALATMCAGGLVIAWLSGASLGAAKPVRGGAALAHAAAAALAVACVCYIALHRERLIDFVVETLLHGPDR